MGSDGPAWLILRMSLLGTTPITGSEDEVSLLGLATAAAGWGVATLVRRVLLRRGWLLLFG